MQQEIIQKKIKSWPHLPSPCVLLGLCLQPRVSNRYSNSPLSGFFWVSQVNTLIQILCCYFITIIRAFLVFSICLLMFYLKVEGKMILYLYCFLNQKQKQLQSSGKPKYYNQIYNRCLTWNTHWFFWMFLRRKRAVTNV